MNCKPFQTTCNELQRGCNELLALCNELQRPCNSLQRGLRCCNATKRREDSTTLSYRKWPVFTSFADPTGTNARGKHPPRSEINRLTRAPRAWTSKQGRHPRRAIAAVPRSRP